MKEQKIRSTGQIEIHDKISGKGSTAAKEFLSSLIEHFARESKKNIDYNGYTAYEYQERQLHSVLSVAFSRFVDSFLMEAPLQRQWSIEQGSVDSHGWADYICDYKGYKFIIEIKHSFLSSKTCHLRKDTIEKWITADKQLNVLNEVVKRNAELCKKGVFRLALLVSVFYKKVNTDDPDFLENKNTISNVAQTAFSTLDPKPNWIGTWILHKNLIEASSYREKNITRQYMPAVTLIAKISDLEKAT